MRDLFQNILPERLQPNPPRRLPAQYRQNNLSSLDQFRQRLLIEQRRAERLNSATSLIVLNLNRYFNGRNEQEAAARLHIDVVVRNICGVIRETDAACRSQESFILILLPDTDAAAARRVYERVIRQLGMRLHANAEAEHLHLDETDMKIISYPEKLIHEQASKLGVDRETMDDHRNPWAKPSLQSFA